MNASWNHDILQSNCLDMQETQSYDLPTTRGVLVRY
jgi:hypothetical protein